MMYYNKRAVGSLVVRASDSRPEGLGSMLDVTKYPPSAHGFTCRNCGGGDRGRVAIYRPFGEVSLSLNRTVTCMVLKANDRRTSCPCHNEFRGPRSDYVRQQYCNQNNGREFSNQVISKICAMWKDDVTVVHGKPRHSQTQGSVERANQDIQNILTAWMNDNDTNKCCPAHVIENVDKITEIIEVDWHISNRSITQELKIDHKIVLSHLRKVGLKKKAPCLGAHQLTPKNMMDQISIREALARWNEIDPFLKRMVTGDDKWVPYDNIVRKRLWSKRGVKQLKRWPN
ncbi:histone-lysine N-methyltransferase SETMAR [Trichonephila clavipes]|nr:histone-lysine N-methyltransferase SETMAR [Trichonephila clavipes]